MFHKINPETFNKLIDLALDVAKGIMGFGGVAFFAQKGDLASLIAGVITVSGVILAGVALIIDHKVKQRGGK